MVDELDRRELPLQAIKEYEDKCHAIVPVHPRILKLSLSIRTDASIIGGLRKTIEEWYDADLRRHFDILHDAGYDMPEWADKYDGFRKEWQLQGIPNQDFLKLVWNDGKENHKISYVNVPPSVLRNQHNEFGEFYSPEDSDINQWVEVLYRNVGVPDSVYMQPEKMRRYGTQGFLLKQVEGVSEVTTTEFCSEPTFITAEAFLLRDFAVAYLNKLLKIAEALPQNN